jgi:hypothetical protein
MNEQLHQQDTAKRVVPLDVIRAFHNAFRKDMAAIDAAANSSAHGQGSLDLVLKSYNFFNEALVWHAHGVEEFVFQAVENVAPLVAEAYQRDHRGLDLLYESLDRSVKEADLISIARVTAEFNFHLSFHLDKEEAHLYRIFNERISIPDQAVIIGKMAQKVPQERFPEAIAWLFPLLGTNDRENMIRIWRQSMPQPVFSNVIVLIRTAIGREWAEVADRIPDLK